MTDLTAQPVLTVEIEPTTPITVSLENATAEDLIEEHEQKLDPHPQYSTDADLIAHTSNTAAHIPAGGLTNTQIATNAAIDWGKISKTGAAAEDVGATSALHGIDSSIHIPSGGISNNQVAPNAAIAWSKIDKTGAAAADVGAATSGHTHAGSLIDSSTAPSNPTIYQRWRNTSDQLIFFWSGQYWLSEQIFLARSTSTTLNANTSFGHLEILENYNYFLLDFRFTGQFFTPQNTTDRWVLSLERVNTNATFTTVTSINTGLTVTSSFTPNKNYVSLNLHQDLTALNPVAYRATAQKFSSGGDIVQMCMTTRYRLARAA